MSSKVKGLNVNWNIIYDFVYVFHRNIGLACTVSAIFAQIDDKGPYWTFLTFKMAFRVISYFLFFLGYIWFHTKEATWCYDIWATLCYYWILSIIMGKWVKPDLSDNKHNSIKSISWQLINIIPRKLYAKVHQYPAWEASCQNRTRRLSAW